MIKLNTVIIVLMVSFANCFANIKKPQFVVLPYIVDVSQNHATIAMELNKPMKMNLAVQIGKKTRTVTSKTSSSMQFLNINNLQPGSRYRYKVFSTDGTLRTPKNDPSYEIKTANIQGESFRFAIYGDPRPGENNTHYFHKEVIKQIIQQEPSFALVLGDMVNNGTHKKEWHDFLRIEHNLLKSTAIFPVNGDNDYMQGKGIVSQYFPRLKKGYYAFKWGGVQFFALNAWDATGYQETAELGEQSEQFRWFTSKLQEPAVKNASFRVVFLHDPVIISRGRSARIMKETWAPVFENNNIDIVFASWHLYERLHHSGVTYIITGGAGSELIWLDKNPAYKSYAEAKKHHFCQVDVTAETMEIKAITKDGTVIDEFVLTPKSQKAPQKNMLADIADKTRKELFFNTESTNNMLEINLFSTNCRYCKKLTSDIIPTYAQKHNISVQVNLYDMTFHEKVYDLYLGMSRDFQAHNLDLPSLFLGNNALAGKDAISQHLEKEFMQFKKDPELYYKNSTTLFTQKYNQKNLRQKEFSALTFNRVFMAGLRDSINPCAFTMLIFLLLILTVAGANRRRLLWTGIFFTLGVFISYFVIGIMFFQVSGLISGSTILMNMVDYGLLVFLVILFILTIFDYINCFRGNAQKMTVKLPSFLQWISKDYIGKFTKNNSFISAAAFLAGAAIALLELTCTGQVYLPIVTLIAHPDHRVMALIYLFIYNSAFIVPVIAVFLLVFFAFTSKKISHFYAHHIALAKLGLAILFLSMALMVTQNII